MKKFTFLIAFLVGINLSLFSQLAAGDIAIFGINTVNADAFGFVALVDIPASTSISFTDNGVFADGSLRTGEETLIWSHTSIISKGTVVTWENPNWSVGSSTGSNPAFSEGGDQCIAYAGSSSSPTYIFGLNIANSGWVTSGDLSSNTSYLPLGLTEGTDAIQVGSDDNGYYSGTTTGSKVTLQTNICSNANWTTNNSRIEISTWPLSFTITDGENQAPLITNIINTPNSPTASQTVSVSADITDSDGTITSAELHWAIISEGPYTTITMSNVSRSDTYTTVEDIPAQSLGTTVYYKVYAIDDETGETTSTEYSYTISHPQPSPGDLVINEVNSTSSADATYTEIYNTTSVTLSLEKVNLEHYSNGSSTASSVLNLTGSVDGYKYIVISRKISDFNSVYSFDPDFEFPKMVLNGDADGLILNHDENGILDQFNNVPSATISWSDNHLFYRFDYSANGSSITNDWDDAGINRNGTPKAKNELTWLTTGTDNWGARTNWSNGDLPSKGVDVIIPSGGTQPLVDGTMLNPERARNLTVNSGAILTVIDDGFLTISGNLTNNAGGGGLLIQSSSSGNGSIIVEGIVTGTATVERYFKGYSEPTADNGWHNIGSPVSNMLIEDSDFDTKGTTNDLYQWNESTSEWENYKADMFTNFLNGKGYLCSFENSGTQNFVGTLNTGNYTVSGLTKGADGFNFLGNPYASALIWNNGAYTPTNVGAVAQIWEESKPGYSQIAADGIIPSTNGFFVEVQTAPGSVIIPASARTHNSINNYKKGAQSNYEETMDLRITNDSNSYYDVCRVGFRNDATEAWDIQYDAHKLFGGLGTSQIWSVIDDEEFVFNYLPYVYESFQLPVYFKAGTNAIHHLTVTGIDSFYENSGIFLEDKLTGNLINLSEQQHITFEASTDDVEARFVLHFSGITSNGEELFADETYIYSSGNTIYFRSDRLVLKNAQLAIFNTLGQKIFSGLLEPGNLSSIKLNDKPGIYVVRLQTKKGILTEKIMIK